MDNSKLLRLLTAQNLLLGAGVSLLVSHDSSETRCMVIGTVLVFAGGLVWILNGKNIRMFLREIDEEG